MDIGSFNLHDTFVVLDPDNHATPEENNADLYTRIDARYDKFKSHQLLSAHIFTEDWANWEIHPKGDEVVLLITGEATLRLKINNTEHIFTLSKPGDYVLVPRNTWHTAEVPNQAALLFVTPGEGTQHQPV
ncbi:cupin domain-containing protein [Alteromonas pelagimontana]|uniref:Cupin domain-containing protein n=1 Tax=Alteromonas pelagimontana TaxID=1858656 RepID=A0A6M4MAR3_9ALTE|nr:cupin domain-containing protein [Alteromonas pelagimontana]QJR79750.1 cupin domain-containing protein [Alteromonas pelagimontana]